MLGVIWKWCPLPDRGKKVHLFGIQSHTCWPFKSFASLRAFKSFSHTAAAAHTLGLPHSGILVTKAPLVAHGGFPAASGGSPVTAVAADALPPSLRVPQGFPLSVLWLPRLSCHPTRRGSRRACTVGAAVSISVCVRERDCVLVFVCLCVFV